MIKEARKFEIELDFVTHCAGANDMHASFSISTFSFSIWTERGQSCQSRNVCITKWASE